MNPDIIITPKIQRYANCIARDNGYGRATAIKFEKQLKCPLISTRIEPGWRKKTTGDYVPFKYRLKSRGHGIFYQHAETTVVLPMEILEHLT